MSAETVSQAQHHLYLVPTQQTPAHEQMPASSDSESFVREAAQFDVLNVPTLDTLKDAFLKVREAVEIDGVFYTNDGVKLDSAVVQEARKKTNPNAWRLTADETDRAVRVQDVDHRSQLEPQDKRDYREFLQLLKDSGVIEKEKQAPVHPFQMYKESLQKRLELSTSIEELSKQMQQRSAEAEHTTPVETLSKTARAPKHKQELVVAGEDIVDAEIVEEVAKVPEEIIIEEEPSKDLVVFDAKSKQVATTGDETARPLADIVTFSKNGHARRGSGNTFADNKFLSNYELEQIEAHAEQIRGGMGKHERLIGLMALDARGLGHRANGQIMSRAEVAALNAARRHEVIPYPAATTEEVNGNDKGRWVRVTAFALRMKESAGSRWSTLWERGKFHKKAIASIVVGALALGLGAANIPDRDTTTTGSSQGNEQEADASGQGQSIFGPDGEVRGLTNPDDRQAGATQDDLVAKQGGSATIGATTIPDMGESGKTSGATQTEGLPFVDEEAVPGVGDTVSLSDGSNPWRIAEDQLRARSVKATVVHTDMVKDEMLRLNNMTEEDARHLGVGTSLKVPSNEWYVQHGLVANK